LARTEYSKAEEGFLQELEIRNRQQYAAGLNREESHGPALYVLPNMPSTHAFFKIA
jgi:hypothetical protein